MEKENTTPDTNEIVEQTIQAALPMFKILAKQAAEAAAEKAATIGAETGAAAAIDAIEHEKRKVQRARYDKRLHNTKLLLRNYNMLNEHYKNAVYELTGIEEEDLDVVDVFEIMESYLYDEGLYVESIKKSATRTKIIMEHVNKMLDIYRIFCKQSHRQDHKRHYRVIKGLYLSPRPDTASFIAKQEHVDKRTVYRDVDAACETLTALIFGIDGIRK